MTICARFLRTAQDTTARWRLAAADLCADIGEAVRSHQRSIWRATGDSGLPPVDRSAIPSTNGALTPRASVITARFARLLSAFARSSWSSAAHPSVSGHEATAAISPRPSEVQSATVTYDVGQSHRDIQLRFAVRVANHHEVPSRFGLFCTFSGESVARERHDRV